MNQQVDANVLIDEYAKKLAEATHENLLLKAYIRQLEEKLNEEK